MNGSSAVVLSGERDAVQEAVGRLAGRRVHWLEVSHAFHSPLMRPVADGLARVVAGIRFAEPRVPLVSALTGAVAGDELRTGGYWAAQARQPVRFAYAAPFSANIRMTRPPSSPFTVRNFGLPSIGIGQKAGSRL